MSIEQQDDWKLGWRHGAGAQMRRTTLYRSCTKHRNCHQHVESVPATKEYNDGYDAGGESRKAACMRAERLYPVDLTERILSQ